MAGTGDTQGAGARAEQAAANHLISEGYEIVERNYRRPHCEIDIVARKQGVVYLVEVKYRADDHFGGGLDYIARDKLRRMRRGAQTWVRERRWEGEYTLSAIEVGGPGFEIQEFIPEVY